MPNECNKCDHQQHVDQTASGMKHDKPEQPRNDQDYGKRCKHGSPLVVDRSGAGYCRGRLSAARSHYFPLYSPANCFFSAATFGLSL